MDGSHPPVRKKVFVQRDYSFGMKVAFQTRMPDELDGRLDQDMFQNTIERLNKFYAEAEDASVKQFTEGCFACLTAYLIYVCMDTHYEKVLKKVAKYLDEQNRDVYTQRGLLIKNPIESGLRSIEIVIYEDTSQP